MTDIDRFKKRVEKKRKAIQRQKWNDLMNLPPEGQSLEFVDEDYDGELRYGMAKMLKEREPRDIWDFVDYMTIWWDGVGWRRVRKEGPSGYVSISPSSKYWTPVQSKDDVPAPGQETSSPKSQESERHWWQFSRKSNHTST